MGKHVGLAKLRKKVAARGMAAVDRRSAAVRAVRAWERELLEDLGGVANVSTQRRTIVELAMRTRLYISHADAFLLEQESLVNKSKKTLLPIVQQRQQLVDSLTRLLGQLGLDRQAKKVEDLDAFLERRAKENEQEKKDELEASDRP